MAVVLGVVVALVAAGALALRRKAPLRSGRLELGAALVVVVAVGAALANFAETREIGAIIAHRPVDDEVSGIDRLRQQRRYDLEAERGLRRVTLAVLPGLVLVLIAFGWRRRREEEGARGAGAAVGLAIAGTGAAALAPWLAPPHGPSYHPADPLWLVLEAIVEVEGGAFDEGCPTLERNWVWIDRDRADLARRHPEVTLGPVPDELRARRGDALVACIDEQLARAQRADEPETRRLMVEALDGCAWEEVEHPARDAALAAPPPSQEADPAPNCSCWGPPELGHQDLQGEWTCTPHYN